MIATYLLNFLCAESIVPDFRGKKWEKEKKENSAGVKCKQPAYSIFYKWKEK